MPHTELSVLHTEATAGPTLTSEGDRSVTVSLRFSHDNYSSGSRAHLSWRAGRELLDQLTAIYQDHDEH